MRHGVKNIAQVTTAEVPRLLDGGAVYLDVRTVEEFDLGHVPGAYNVPLAHGSKAGLQDNPDFVTVVEASFSKDQSIIVGCRTGARAKRAIGALQARQFEHLSLHGPGWDGQSDPFGRKSGGWLASGQAVEQGASPGHTYAELQYPQTKRSPT